MTKFHNMKNMENILQITSYFFMQIFNMSINILQSFKDVGLKL